MHASVAAAAITAAAAAAIAATVVDVRIALHRIAALQTEAIR